jgi:hypothetical protein
VTETHDALVAEALAAADRVQRYHRLRRVTIAVALVVSALVGVNTYRITQLNGDLCDRSLETRQAVRELAQATLITTPIPSDVDDATRQQILATRRERAEAVAAFRDKYPRVEC